MIRAIIYDKVANTQIGQMGGEMRVVGYRYNLPGIEPDAKGDHPKLEIILEDKRLEQKVIVLTYSDGSQQIIPDRGVEKIFKVK